MVSGHIDYGDTAGESPGEPSLVIFRLRPYKLLRPDQQRRYTDLAQGCPVKREVMRHGDEPCVFPGILALPDIGQHAVIYRR
jgi:hypothetical protein